jgi:hypothetical protein
MKYIPSPRNKKAIDFVVMSFRLLAQNTALLKHLQTVDATNRILHQLLIEKDSKAA